MTESSTNPIPTSHRVQRITTAGAKLITFVVYAYVVLVEVILMLGFVLLLFGANPSSTFVAWVYRNLDRAMRPFRGIFEPVELGIAGNDIPAVIETSVIFAMVVYAILALVLAQLLHWLTVQLARIDDDNTRFTETARYENGIARSRGYADSAAELAALRQAEAVRAGQAARTDIDTDR